MATDDLTKVSKSLDLRCDADGRLEMYRVAADDLAGVTELQGLSGDLRSIYQQGGWWPGELFPPSDATDDVITTLTLEHPDTALARKPTVQWVLVGTMWDDVCYSPLVASDQQSAPVLIESSEWKSMTFPSEAAFLEAFQATYDVLGYDDQSEGVNPLFVEWITDDPPANVGPKRHEIRAELQRLSQTWQTNHPIWRHDLMPFLDYEIPSPTLAAHLLGVEESDLRYT